MRVVHCLVGRESAGVVDMMPVRRWLNVPQEG